MGRVAQSAQAGGGQGSVDPVVVRGFYQLLSPRPLPCPRGTRRTAVTTPSKCPSRGNSEVEIILTLQKKKQVQGLCDSPRVAQ